MFHSVLTRVPEPRLFILFFQYVLKESWQLRLEQQNWRGAESFRIIPAWGMWWAGVLTGQCGDSPGCIRSSITDCSEMEQSCCAGRILKIQLKDSLRSCKHTLTVMTMTDFWQLNQSGKRGVLCRDMPYREGLGFLAWTCAKMEVSLWGRQVHVQR